MQRGKERKSRKSNKRHIVKELWQDNKEETGPPSDWILKADIAGKIASPGHDKTEMSKATMKFLTGPALSSCSGRKRKSTWL